MNKVQMLPDNSTTELPEFHAYSLGWVDEIVKSIDTSPQKKLDILKSNLIQSVVFNPFQNTIALAQETQEKIKNIGIDLAHKTEPLFNESNELENKNTMFLEHFRNYIDYFLNYIIIKKKHI